MYRRSAFVKTMYINSCVYDVVCVLYAMFATTYLAQLCWNSGSVMLGNGTLVFIEKKNFLIVFVTFIYVVKHM